MKTLLIVLLSISVKAYDKAASDADNRLCQAAKDLARVSLSLKAQRELEAVSGVKDMKLMRDLGARWLDRAKEFSEAIEASKKAGGFVKNFTEDCKGISATEEKAATDEMILYFERTGRKAVVEQVKKEHKYGTD